MITTEPTAGILIVNTYPPEFGNIMGDSENNLAAKLGPTYKVRTASALKEMGPVPEQGVIFKGSPYSLLEPREWIEGYRELIRAMITQGKIVLGICFGHQGLAESYGGQITQTGSPQFGVQTIRLTEEGQRHPLFQGIPSEIRLPGSHFDHVAVVETTRQKILATSADCPVYALDIATNGHGAAWGVQFHPEMDGKRLAEVIELKKDHIPDWQKRKRAARRAKVDDYGDKIMQNYAHAVLRAKRV